ncbi:hypothetical protein NP511_12445 [Natrinema thermotolerans]|uniref:Uncharacterized protein n=1 Tax=Natrinema thermotolerans TaxID=121872 RepID=A0AAF0PCH9_9EURY|nr:hypothetical protein [Natrinema thermotolerans]WMT06193.1 hypothetical protein NP511_12445 [Natrinema thermotolerans]
MTAESRIDGDPVTWGFLLSCLGLAAIHLYLATLAPSVSPDDARQFLLIGAALLVGPAVYVTRYWHPVLYLLGAALAVYLGVLWLLSGTPYPLVGVLTGLVATAFVLLSLLLFVREQSPPVES